jgi:hypothetical protein
MVESQFTADRYKDSIDSEIAVLNFELRLVVEILSNSEKLSKDKYKEAHELFGKLHVMEMPLSEIQSKEYNEAMDTMKKYWIEPNKLPKSFIQLGRNLFKYIFCRN